MALQDTLLQLFSSGGFALDEAAGKLADAFKAVSPDGVDVDDDGIAALAEQIAAADPSGALSAVTALEGRYGTVLGGIKDPADLLAPLTHAIDALTTLGSQSTDLRTAVVAALTSPQPGERPVDRFAAGAGVFRGLHVGPLGEILKALAPGAVPSLPTSVTGVTPALLGQAAGLPALADNLSLLTSGSTVVARARTLAAALTELADLAPVDAARTAVLTLDGTELAARVSSGDPDDEVVAAVTAGLAVVEGFADAVNRLVLGGLAMLDVLDLAPAEALLTQAAAAAGSANVAPVHSLAQTLTTQLDPVLGRRPTAADAASVTAFADFLDGQLAQVVAAVGSLDTAQVAKPVQDAVDTVLAPVRAVQKTLHDAVATLRSALDSVRTAIQTLGSDAVADAVHTVIDPVAQVLDQLRALLDPVATTLGSVAAETSTAIADLRTAVSGTIGQIEGAFRAVADAVDALHLDQLQGVRTTMDQVADTVEGIDIGSAVDEAVGFIHDAAGVVSKIPFDLLPGSARTEVSSALEPLKEIDFGTEVREPLSDALEEVLAEIDGAALEELTQAFAGVAEFLAGIDPQPALRTVEAEGFDPFIRGVQAIDPDVIIAPIKEALRGLGSLGSLLDPADAAFDELLHAVESLDPGPLLDPLATQVDAIRAEIVSTVALDHWVAEVDQACDRMLQVTDLVHFADLIDMAEVLLDELWPASDSPRRGLAGAQLVTRLVGPAAATLDVVSFATVGDWLAGSRTPGDDLVSALGAAKTAVRALHDGVAAVDPAAVLPTVGPAFDQVAAAIAALPAGSLKDRLSPLVATPPVTLLQPAVDARGDVLARVDVVSALVDRLATVVPTGLGTLAVALRTAMAPLTDALHEFAASWAARAGATPGPDLRAAVHEVFTVVADRLRPQAAAFDAAVQAKLRVAVEEAIRTPLRTAASDLAALIAEIDLHPLVNEIEALFTAVHDPLAALRPSTALGDLVTAIDGLIGDAAVWDPFRDVRGPLNQMKADVTAVVSELRPTALFGPVLETYAEVTQALAAIDVGSLFDRTLTALHTLESDLEEGLAAAEEAFGELQDALP